jgi:hypothetical protein
VGNGGPPHIIIHWILTSQFWASENQARTLEKRARQMIYLKQNMEMKGHIWFYYDLHHSRVLYINGEEKA